MTSPFFDSSICIRLVLTLGHFLWQGAAILLLVGIAGWLLRRASAGARYGVYVAGLVLMTCCPLITFLAGGQREATATFVPPAPAVVHRSDPAPALPKGSAEDPSAIIDASAPLPITPTPEVQSPLSDRSAPTRTRLTTPSTKTAAFNWQRYAPHVVFVYLLGATLMLVRLLLGVYGGQRLRQRSAPVSDNVILAALNRQVGAMGLRFTPVIAYCRSVCVPTVVGVLRPMILLPISIASGLTTEQLEVLLAHELAHIRRFDHVVNLFQRLVEALLFFHPAVWFISRRIRIERELCCDDLVIATGGQRFAYAESLVRMAEICRVGSAHQPGHNIAALAATGQPSQFHNRILRLIGSSTPQRVRLRRTWTFVFPILLMAAFTVNCLLPSRQANSFVASTTTQPVTEDVAILAKQTQSAKQLHAIGIALGEYRGEAPVTLQALVNEKLLDPTTLISPLAVTTTQPSYVLIRPGPGHDPRNVFVFENLSHFDGKATMVLWGDGHADWISMPGFREALAATFKRIGRHVPTDLTQEAVDAALAGESSMSAIKGRFVLSGYSGDIDYWELNLQVDPTFTYPDGLTSEQKEAWLKNWKTTPAGKPYIVAKRRGIHESEGSFRIEDLSPGHYTLDIAIYAPRAKGCEQYIGSVRHEFQITENTGSTSDKTLDLGTLTIKATGNVIQTRPTSAPSEESRRVGSDHQSTGEEIAGQIPPYRTEEESSLRQKEDGSDQAPKTVALDLGKGVKLELVRIPAGEFIMGSPTSEYEHSGNESPQHRVQIRKAFYLSKYEVTQAQWQVVMEGNPSKFKESGNRPVEQVSWNDCQEFCRIASLMTGREIRLPTEAEWEYACRAGTTTPFSFGETISTDQANYDGHSKYRTGSKGIYRGKTTMVGSFPANAWGLHDMHGNVWEWCEDGWHQDYLLAPDDGSAWKSDGNLTERVLRGGSWSNDPGDCRSAARNWSAPDDRDYDNIGFRIATALGSPPASAPATQTSELLTGPSRRVGSAHRNEGEVPSIQIGSSANATSQPTAEESSVGAKSIPSNKPSIAYRKGEMRGRVLLPDGMPAAGVRVVLSTRQLNISSRIIRGVEEEAWVSDAGDFSIYVPDEPLVMLVWDDKGFAQLTEKEFHLSQTIRLQAWSRVEGTIHIGSKIGAGETALLTHDFYNLKRDQAFNPVLDPRVVYQARVEADDQGRFVMERVPPGLSSICQERREGERVSYSPSTKIDVPPGQTMHVQIGGSGRPVIGRLSLQGEHKDPIPWAIARIVILSKLPPGHNDLGAVGSVQVTVTPQDSGVFRVEDVPPGTYYLHAISDPRMGLLFRTEFTVPGSRSDEPLDLGTLILKPRNSGSQTKPASAPSEEDRRADSAHQSAGKEIGGQSPSYTTAGDTNDKKNYKTENTTSSMKKKIHGIVRLPDGKPAADVKVTVGTYAINVVDDKVTLGKKGATTTSATGEFTLVQPEAKYRLIVIGDLGYAEARQIDFEKSYEIRMQPWARIEGEFRIGSKPGTGETMSIGRSSWMADPNASQPAPGFLEYGNVFFFAKAVVDERGHFVFDHVPAGKVTISRLKERDFLGLGATNSMLIKTRSGEVKHVIIGGSGRPVIGQLSCPHVPADQIKWRTTAAGFSPKKPEKFSNELLDRISYTIIPDDQGRFRIDDIAPGVYELQMDLLSQPGRPGDNPDWLPKLLGRIRRDVTVPEIPGGRTDEPLDLGTLKLEPPQLSTKPADSNPLPSTPKQQLDRQFKTPTPQAASQPEATSNRTPPASMPASKPRGS